MSTCTFTIAISEAAASMSLKKSLRFSRRGCGSGSFFAVHQGRELFEKGFETPRSVPLDVETLGEGRTLSSWL
jgi:hypothetical protein